MKFTDLMKKHIFPILILASLMLAATAAAAQPILKCTEYKSGGAMDHTRVSTYEQDSKGILWFGTWIGLCRYDGKEFHYFNTNDGASGGASQPLGSNRILKLNLDSRENIWCQNYDQGLYRFDRVTSTFQAVLPLVKDYPAQQSLKDKVYVMRRNRVVWAVLADGTLVRFQDADPSQNEVIPCEAGQKNRTVYGIQEDSFGREWVLTDYGVILYGQKGWITTYPYTHFLQQGEHCFLAARNTAQLVEYQGEGVFRNIELPSQIRFIRYMQPHGEDRILLGTDRGLVIYDVRTRQLQVVDTATDGRRVENIGQSFTDSQGRIWIFAGETGVYCLRPGEARCEYLQNPEPDMPKLNESGKLYLITQDANGVVWLKPSRGELCWYCEEDGRLHSHREAMAPGETLPIHDYNFYFVDLQRNLWVSSGTRLYHLTFARRQFHSIQTDPDVEIRSLFAEDSLHVWYGDKLGHLCRMNVSDRSSQYLTPQGQWTDRKVPFCTHGIFHIMQTRDGQILLGTRGDGLFRLIPQGKGFRVSNYRAAEKEGALNCDVIYDMYQDENDRVWVASFGGGLNLMESVTDDTLRFLNGGFLGYPMNSFEMSRCVQGDGAGRIMVGTNKGLVVFSSKFNRLSDLKFQTYQAQSEQGGGLPDNMIMRIVYTPGGDFYISSFARGLCKVEGDGIASLQFRHLPNRDFPAGDVNATAIALSSGQIWTIAECGITCYRPQQEQMWYFDQHDFDRPYSMTECEPVELHDGRLLLGMFGGILVFRPASIQKSEYRPKIVFTERLYAVGAQQYVQELNDVDTLYIEPHQRSSSLRFAAIDFVQSSLVRYAYWMHSAGSVSDKQWVYAESPEVNFTNLAPGKYDLHLKSTNSDGVWIDNERVLRVIVVPTFWEQWGGLIILLLLLTASGIAVFVYVRHLKQRQQSVMKQEVSAVKINMLTNPAPQVDQEFIKNVMAYLTEHLSDGDLQVNDVADALNMSRATFYRRLKQSADLSPNDFIHQVRMRQAAERLATTNDPVSIIAYSVGFNNPKYFSKCFRQDYDMSPLEYRQHARAKAAASAEDEGGN